MELVKITYRFADGHMEELEVEQEVAETIKELDRQEYNNNQKESRRHVTFDVSEELAQYFGDKLFQTVIPRNVRLAEAPAHGVPVMYFEKSSKGAVSYLTFAAELVKKMKKAEQKQAGQKQGAKS